MPVEPAAATAATIATMSGTKNNSATNYMAVRGDIAGVHPAVLTADRHGGSIAEQRWCRAEQGLQVLDVHICSTTRILMGGRGGMLQILHHTTHVSHTAK